MGKINMYVIVSHTKKNRHIITVFIHATCHKRKKRRCTHPQKGDVTHTRTL